MATTLKPSYGAHTAITITSLNSLANNAYAGSAVVDNTVSLWVDALVSVRVTANSTGVSTTGSITIFAYGDVDTTTYTDGVTGTDAVQTVPSPTNLRPLGIGNVNTNSGVFRAGPFSVASLFGGRLPGKWGIVVLNGSGAALAASGHVADMIGVQDTGV